jgi:metal-dependent amidase/aminoacylase/carboxypeptidase family protein
VIPDEEIIKLNVRTFDEDVRKRVLAAIERIVNAEAEASRTPKKPEITLLDRYPLVKNDPEATKRAIGAFRSYFRADRVKDTQPTTASEDFGSFGTEWQVPSVFWFVGGPLRFPMLDESLVRSEDCDWSGGRQLCPTVSP